MKTFLMGRREQRNVCYHRAPELSWTRHQCFNFTHGPAQARERATVKIASSCPEGEHFLSSRPHEVPKYTPLALGRRKLFSLLNNLLKVACCTRQGQSSLFPEFPPHPAPRKVWRGGKGSSGRLENNPNKVEAPSFPTGRVTMDQGARPGSKPSALPRKTRLTEAVRQPLHPPPTHKPREPFLGRAEPLPPLPQGNGPHGQKGRGAASGRGAPTRCFKQCRRLPAGKPRGADQSGRKRRPVGSRARAGRRGAESRRRGRGVRGGGAPARRPSPLGLTLQRAYRGRRPSPHPPQAPCRLGTLHVTR